MNQFEKTLISVSENPSQDDSYLTYDVDKNYNIFLKNIVRDKAIDNQLHQQGHYPLSSTINSFYDPTPVNFVSNKIEVVGEQKEKGLYEQIILEKNINNIQNNNDGTVSFSSDGIYKVGDVVFIQGVDLIPTGNYKIIESQLNNYKINCLVSFLKKQEEPLIYKIEYRWDEMYTTPLGGFLAVNYLGSFPSPESLEPVEGDMYFNLTTENNEVFLNGIWEEITNYFYLTETNVLNFHTKDPNVFAQENDFLVIQILNDETITSEEMESIIDGVNSVANNLGVETFMFKVKSTNISPYGEQSLTLDKSFELTSTLIQEHKYKFKLTLLNRGTNSISKNLYENTWEFHEIHQKQLLGDFATNNNYLYYGGSEYLGITTQISDFLKSTKTPIILLHFGDKIHDRLSLSKGELELCFPNLLIQGELPGQIFTNDSALYDKSVGTYSSLILKYPKTNFNRLGWVFNDLRIVIIDNEEIVTALSYNSNRNYTLPGSLKTDYNLLIPDVNNRNKNFNKNNPLSIVGVEQELTGNIKVTFNINPKLKTGDIINIEGVTSIGIEGSMYNNINKEWQVVSISNSNPKIFEYYLAYNVSVNPVIYWNPTDGFNTLYQGEGICYQNKPDYDYFITYRVRGKFYNTLPMATLLPFNFSKTESEYVKLSIPFLTHLAENKESSQGFHVTDKIINGMIAPHFDVIIGTYTFNQEDPLTITGVENVKIIPGEYFYNNNEKQNNKHELIVSLSSYLSQETTTTLKAKTTAINEEILFNTTTNMFYKFFAIVPSNIDLTNWIFLDDDDKTKNGWYPTNCGIYDLTNEEKLYNINNFEINTPQLLTGDNIWLLGNIKYKESVNQYRLTINAKIPANKWNSTTNPTFKVSETITNKLISEIAFVAKEVSEDGTEVLYDETPYIYAKINPPIKKSNTADISLSLSIDF